MGISRSNLKVTLENRGLLTLRPNDHIATGGEGSIYRAGDTALKIYLKPEKAIWNDVAGKVVFFNANQNPYIVGPKGKVYNEMNEIIGYYMDFISTGESIARVFTNEYWRDKGFEYKDVFTLVARMREIIQFAHNHNALLIDANELGYFVIPGQHHDPEPRIIDVDSWVLNNKFPPQVAIMPSIRDWHTNGWNSGSDWFAWGIVTFQVFTGIHPYKGGLNGYKPNEMERRMKNNASVFTPDIRLNHAVRDLFKIPGLLYDWYVATFQDGNRSVPPSPFDTGVAKTQITKILYATTTATGTLVFERLFSKIDDTAIKVFSCGVALLESGSLVDLATKKEIYQVRSRDCEVIKTQQGWLIATFEGQELSCVFVNENNLERTSLLLTLRGSRFLRYENRLFLVTDQGATEIMVNFLSKPILTIGQTWGVMVNSTRWFDGLGIQDALGAMFLVVPFGEYACAQIRVKELDGLTPITAKAGNRFATVIALDKQGGYQKLELAFAANYQTYKLWQGGTDGPNLNVAILPKLVCATIVNDGELTVYIPQTGVINKVADKQITTKMFLFNWNNLVVYIVNGSVWSIHMR